MEEGTEIMHEIRINEYKDPDPAGSVLFLVAVKETVTRYYRTKWDAEGKRIKTAKEVRTDFERWGAEGWHEKDCSDWDNARISKVEKVVYSPCSLALQYLTPPAHWTEESHPSIRYLERSTMFDEQPAGSVSVFNKDAITRRYVRCTNYIHGKTSQICPNCLRRIKGGWSIIHPIKKEDSQ